MSHDLAVRPAERLAEGVVDAGARRVDAAVDDVRLAVDHDDDARDRLHQRARDVALALQLDLALLALRHVAAADEEEAPLVDCRQEDARPEHRQAPTALRHPRAVVVADGLAGRDTLDQLPHRRRLLRSDVVVPEHGAGRLVRLHLELALERLVGAAGLDHPVLVDQQEEARRLVRDRVQELALALAGRSLLVARRDVDAARDDPPGPAVLVRKRGGAPEDDAVLAAAVDEGVLVLDGRVDGRGCLEARDHVRALRLVDEDVPELAAADRLLVVLARRLDRGDVLVHDRPLRVEMDEEARRGVDERDEEAELGAQLGLEPHVLEREPDRRRDEVDRVRLLGERRIVDERGHPPAAALDRRHGPLGRRRRLLDVPAVRVDPAFAVAEAVDDLERRVVQRVRDRVAERDAGIEREQDPRGAGAVEAAAEHAGEERQRHERRTRSGRAPRRPSSSCSETESSATETVSSAREMPQER